MNSQLSLLMMLFLSSVLSHGASDETLHLLSTSGGISSPSFVSDLVENPAGVIYNQTHKFHMSLSSTNSSLDPLSYAGAFYTGNGSVGGGLSLKGTTPSGGGYALHWGLGASIAEAAFGFAGEHPFGGGNSSALHGGVLITPHSHQRFGITLFNILNGIQAVGAGFAFDLAPTTTLALDAAYSLNTGTTIAKPALLLHISDFEMSAGYGIAFQGGGGGPIRPGLTLGVGFSVSRSFMIKGYYNHFSLYSIGLTTVL